MRSATSILNKHRVLYSIYILSIVIIWSIYIYNISISINNVGNSAQLITYLCLKSAYITLFGKPLRQIRIPSKTPLQRSWWRTRNGSITPNIKHSVYSYLKSMMIQNTDVRPELMWEITWSLGFVGNDAAHKMWWCWSKIGH